MSYPAEWDLWMRLEHDLDRLLPVIRGSQEFSQSVDEMVALVLGLGFSVNLTASAFFEIILRGCSGPANLLFSFGMGASFLFGMLFRWQRKRYAPASRPERRMGFNSDDLAKYLIASERKPERREEMQKWVKSTLEGIREKGIGWKRKRLVYERLQKNLGSLMEKELKPPPSLEVFEKRNWFIFKVVITEEWQEVFRVSCKSGPYVGMAIGPSKWTSAHIDHPLREPLIWDFGAVILVRFPNPGHHSADEDLEGIRRFLGYFVPKAAGALFNGVDAALKQRTFGT